MMAPTKMKLRMRKKESGVKSSRRLLAETSPDSKCPICLDRFNNVASLDRCLHRFCFSCIHEWSKNKAECPLCKQPFRSIFHSVKAENDFKEYVLASVENGPPAVPPPGQVDSGTHSSRVRRHRAARGGERRSRRPQTPGPSPSSLDVRVDGLTESLADETVDQQQGVHHMMLRLTERRRSRVEEHSLRRLRDQDVVAFRRALYRTGVRVRSGGFDGGRQRDVSAAHLRRNPASLRRLLPWLQRELMVLYGSHGSLVSIVQHIIMSRITLHDMDDATIRDELRPFLLARTDHFLHELVSFARSTLSIEAYDQQAVYECPAPSYEEDSGSNSSIIAISEDDDAASEIDITEDIPQDRVPPDPDATGGESFLSQSGWDDETPGPSFSTLFPSPSQSQADRMDPAAATLPAAETRRSGETGLGEEDEDECMIVGYVKPMAERTPELVQLSSNSSEDEQESASAEAVAVTVPKAEASSSQVQAPPSSESYLKPLSPTSCPYPSASHSPPLHTDGAIPQQTDSLHSHSRDKDAERHSHSKKKHSQQHGFRSRSWSSSDSSVLSAHSGHTRSHRHSGSGSVHQDRLSRQESQSWNRPSSAQSLTVSIASDISPDSSRSPVWEQTWPTDKLRPQKSDEERECAHSVSARERSSQSSVYWDSPSHDGERKKARKRRRKEKERERSRSPLQVFSASRSRSGDSRRRHGRHEHHLHKERRSSSSSSIISSSSVDLHAERPCPEKPAGKRKYKTRHLERAAQRQRRQKSSKDKGHPPASRGSPAKKHHSRTRERSRSPSVEIIFERQATGMHSQTHGWRRKRHKKRSRRDAKENSPTVITIESDSDRTNDYQDCITEVTNSTADYQGHGTEVSNSSPDCQHQITKAADSTTNHENHITKDTSTKTDCQGQEITATRSTNSDTDSQLGLPKVTNCNTGNEVGVPEVTNSNIHNQVSLPEVTNRISDPQHSGATDSIPDPDQTSAEDMADRRVKKTNSVNDALLGEAEASSSTSTVPAAPYLESYSPVTPESSDCTLNLEHCVVDVVDRESFNHSQHSADAEQPIRTNDLSQDVPGTTVPTPSDTRLLESILQELEDILPEEGPRVESRQEGAATDRDADQLDGAVVPRRDQSDSDREADATENTETSDFQTRAETSPAVYN